MDCSMVSEQLPACQGYMNTRIPEQRKFRSLLAATENGGPLKALSNYVHVKFTVHTWDQKTKKHCLCPLCRKECHENSYLNSHQRTHTGEKPSDWGPCGKRLRPKTNLDKYKGIRTENLTPVFTVGRTCFSILMKITRNLKKKKTSQNGNKVYASSAESWDWEIMKLGWGWVEGCSVV